MHPLPVCDMSRARRFGGVSAIAIVLGAAARMVVGGAFVWSGISKLYRPHEFAVVLRRFPLARFIARGRFVPLALALLLGLVETSLGAVFALGLGLLWTGAMVLVLLSIFALAMSIAIWKGESASCGCFGSSSDEPVSTRHLLRNAFLGSSAVVGMVLRAGSIDGVLDSVISGREYLLAMAAAMQVSLIVGLLAALVRLRGVPGYLASVPRSEEAALREVWEGTRWGSAHG